LLEGVRNYKLRKHKFRDFTFNCLIERIHFEGTMKNFGTKFIQTKFLRARSVVKNEIN
jgi:hypothetical protein